MTPGYPAQYDRVERLSVASHPGCDTSKVGATIETQDTDMLSLSGKKDSCSVHDDGAYFYRG